MKIVTHQAQNQKERKMKRKQKLTLKKETHK